MGRYRFAPLALVVALVAPAPVAGARDVPAKEGMGKIVAAASGDDEALREAAFPAKLVEGRSDDRPEDVAAWRKAFAAEIAALRKYDVKQAEAEAVVTWTDGNAEKAIRIRLDGATWVLACATSYVVSGEALDRARGKRPAHVTLVPRADNGSYGKSAWSFSGVTGDPEGCKNRMSVWFCGNGDLHACHDHTIAEWGKAELKKAEGLPLGLAFDRWVEPKPGFVYVVKCDRGRPATDFYVKLRVTKLDANGLEFDWELLASGPGAPPSIHDANPVPNPRDGADGCDGICSGKMKPR